MEAGEEGEGLRGGKSRGLAAVPGSGLILVAVVVEERRRGRGVAMGREVAEAETEAEGLIVEVAVVVLAVLEAFRARAAAMELLSPGSSCGMVCKCLVVMVGGAGSIQFWALSLAVAPS